MMMESNSAELPPFQIHVDLFYPNYIMALSRAMVVNAAQLATYSQAKQAILSSGYIQVFETFQFYSRERPA